MFVLVRYSRAEGIAPFYTSSGLAYLGVHVVLPFRLRLARVPGSRWRNISTRPQGSSSFLALCHICSFFQGGLSSPRVGSRPRFSCHKLHKKSARTRFVPSRTHHWILPVLSAGRTSVIPACLFYGPPLWGGHSVRRLPILRYTLPCTPCTTGYSPPPFRPSPRYYYVAPRSILGVFYGIMCTALRPVFAQLVSSSGVAAF